VSKAWARQRAELFAGARSAEAPSKPLARPSDHGTETLERDFARVRGRGRRARVPWLVITVGALAAALMIASLRVSILRLRYQLSAAVSEETKLLERQRAVTVTLRQLRDPGRLHDLAAKRGFSRPERVIQLSVPTTGGGEAAP
jgi:hypothetical protein